MAKLTLGEKAYAKGEVTKILHTILNEELDKLSNSQEYFKVHNCRVLPKKPRSEMEREAFESGAFTVHFEEGEIKVRLSQYAPIEEELD